MAGIR